MNSDLVLQAARASLTGSLPFPEIVRNLIQAGVEYYHVDYILLQFTFYGTNAASVVAPLTFEGLPAVAKDFDVAALRQTILDSQQDGQQFREFSQRAMRAGVQGYFAFLKGARVTYLGRQGDQHTEWFPGAEPKSRVRD
ncbi:MAG: DUF1398 family protein [Nitrospira sp.]|uniref:DUF1398 family protein n=1 Tax=Nitrospira sp. ND1 TaxID=1658518 RepID=UPI0009BBA3A5|nr:DUF1398 family protein [Nitrospira sp. ND1]MBK7421519.1 DUF1398 family protein [Nitrospira sp.]OYT23624.1 MAG: DUF1398 domain-containing protein [Nitrospira sp. UW-LDO-02]MBK9113596.1 DUF1398 family protein [Nitrospira sp.]MBK9996412.1 DUF1398 family protein [Nitrospira sp.]MBP6207478.1 DUF1398 family protein [Nitrospira sp.]